MKLRAIFFGFFVTAAITFLMLLLLSVLMYFTDISSSVGNVCIYAGTAAAVLAGAFAAARIAGGKIFFHSISVGILFVATVVLLSLAVNHGVAFNMHFIAVIAGSLFSAFAGAVLGNR